MDGEPSKKLVAHQKKCNGAEPAVGRDVEDRPEHAGNAAAADEAAEEPGRGHQRSGQSRKCGIAEAAGVQTGECPD